MLNAPCPTLKLPATSGCTFDTEALKGQAFVLYFYPKDSTPGCTTEGGDFRDAHAQFLAAGCQVFGISRMKTSRPSSLIRSSWYPIRKKSPARHSMSSKRKNFTAKKYSAWSAALS